MLFYRPTTAISGHVTVDSDEIFTIERVNSVHSVLRCGIMTQYICTISSIWNDINKFKLLMLLVYKICDVNLSCKVSLSNLSLSDNGMVEIQENTGMSLFTHCITVFWIAYLNVCSVNVILCYQTSITLFTIADICNINFHVSITFFKCNELVKLHVFGDIFL